MRMRFFILVLALSAIAVPTVTGWSRRRRRTPVVAPCAFNSWSGWTCSETCEQRRARTISHQGPGCPSLEEKKPIIFANWGNWGYCSNTCGLGSRIRRRVVREPLNCGGASYSCDKPLSETQSCHNFRNTDCRVSAWSPFGTCVPDNGKCGPGKATRHRRRLQAPTCRGRVCPPLTEERTCNATACCTVSEWSAWACSETCQKLRTRTVTRQGPNCPSYLKETASISISKWGNWGHCTNTCGKGTRARQRSVEDPPNCGGGQYSCDKPLSETQSCYDFKNTDCKVSTWTPFGPCVPENGRCGSGKAMRHRILLQEPICQGTPCPPLTEEIACNASACPVPCTLTEWTEWSGCSQSCGYGHHLRNRRITAPAKHGGLCDKLEEKELCIIGRRTDCQVNEWTSWSKCNGDCSNPGHQVRVRSVSTHPSCGGRPCPTKLHDVKKCPEDCITECDECILSSWTSWTRCVCGETFRRRSIIKHSTCLDKPCPTNLFESKSCQDLGNKCHYKEWGQWSSCESEGGCGEGQKIRTRAPLIPVVSCGKTCKNQNETKPCLIYPVPCQLSEWSEWSPCTSRCGIGVQLRDRKVVIPAKCNGSCGVLNGFQICHGTYCKNTNILIATSAKGK
ncbi:spondin-1-like [Oscarella lobularis]|uniref:spondin-1-like n=1 Tax=Oscarella lobularis TaxID=121494 RepID=UPI003313DF7C